MKKYYKLSDEKLSKKIDKMDKKIDNYAGLTIASYMLTAVSVIGAVGCALFGVTHVALAFVVGIVWQILSVVGFTRAGIKTLIKEDELLREAQRREEEYEINKVVEHIVENLDEILNDISSGQTRKVKNEEDKKVETNQQMTNNNDNSDVEKENKEDNNELDNNL